MALLNRTKNKQFLVIGLGRFGTSIAKALAEAGAEVMAIDRDEENVDAILPFVTQAMQADATEENVLASIDAGSFDAAIVSIGSSIEDSIMISIQCKEAGIPMVISKANDDLHAKVLRKIGVDRVIFPEREMGQRLAKILTRPALLDMMNLPDGYEITEVKLPAAWDGRTLAQLNIRREYRVNILAVRRKEEFIVSPEADRYLQTGDQLLMIGKTTDISRLEEKLQ